MIYEVNHYGIVIRNLDTTLAFYRDVLGAKEVSRRIIPSSQTDVVYLQITGGMIESSAPPFARRGRGFRDHRRGLFVRRARRRL